MLATANCVNLLVTRFVLHRYDYYRPIPTSLNTNNSNGGGGSRDSSSEPNISATNGTERNATGRSNRPDEQTYVLSDDNMDNTFEGSGNGGSRYNYRRSTSPPAASAVSRNRNSDNSTSGSNSAGSSIALVDMLRNTVTGMMGSSGNGEATYHPLHRELQDGGTAQSDTPSGGGITTGTSNASATPASTIDIESGLLGECSICYNAVDMNPANNSGDNGGDSNDVGAGSGTASNSIYALMNRGPFAANPLRYMVSPVLL